MSNSVGNQQVIDLPGREPTLIDRFARSAALKVLGRLYRDQLTWRDGEEVSFGPGDGLHATVSVHHPEFYRQAMLGASVGLGEAWMDGHWDCDDLTAFLRIMIRNEDIWLGVERGSARLTLPARRFFHWLRRNTRTGSRKNIAAHYDLGNALFETFLDPTMAYSAAVFRDPTMSLHDAQLEKFDLICSSLKLNASHHLLEIGTGWGGLAVHAARTTGCRVTTTTISQEQHDRAQQLVREAGLQDRITVLKQDYRDLTGKFDRLVSIEMIEAVGHSHHETFFKVCQERLKDDGLMLLQTITMRDQSYEEAVASVDFIKRCIFPGGCLPSVSHMANVMSKVTDFQVLALNDIGLDYALTLRHWRERFAANLDKVRALGYDERFIRMWWFYFCYCEAGFLERFVSDVQVTLGRRECRQRPLVAAAEEASGPW